MKSNTFFSSNIYDRDFQDGTGLKSDLNVPNFLTIPVSNTAVDQVVSTLHN